MAYRAGGRTYSLENDNGRKSCQGIHHMGVTVAVGAVRRLRVRGLSVVSEEEKQTAALAVATWDLVERAINYARGGPCANTSIADHCIPNAGNLAGRDIRCCLCDPDGIGLESIRSETLLSTSACIERTLSDTSICQNYTVIERGCGGEKLNSRRRQEVLADRKQRSTADSKRSPCGRSNLGVNIDIMTEWAQGLSAAGLSDQLYVSTGSFTRPGLQLEWLISNIESTSGNSRQYPPETLPLLRPCLSNIYVYGNQDCLLVDVFAFLRAMGV
ncbi:hypothetical protein K439DRAFT_1665902 [Ramaria rubella]|nr:hypothetical protein K439DRAFT_1665902 [Ramaria rubella]